MAAAMEKEEESRIDLEFTYLLHETVNRVAVAMTVESANRKMDWRALGGILGFNCQQIDLMQQDMRYPCKGRLLIKLWEDTGKTSVRKLIYALKEAKMGECLNIIKQDFTLDEMDIEKALEEYEYLKANKLLHRQFPRISKDKFNEALFPSVRYDVIACAPPSLCPSTYTENELKTRNSLSEQCQADTILDERSVYISFCPETGMIVNRKFNHQLRRFAQFIQDQGFTLHFEPNCQSQIGSHGGVVLWKEACIKRSKNIIVICTPEYYREDCKAIEGMKKSTRSKIEVDSSYLRQLVFNRSNARVIPIVLDARKPSANQIPMWLQPLMRYSWPSGERDLVLCLEGLPRYILPKVDPKRRKVIKPIIIDYPDIGKRHR